MKDRSLDKIIISRNIRICALVFVDVYQNISVSNTLHPSSGVC